MSKLKYYFKETLEWIFTIAFCISIPFAVAFVLVLIGQFFGIKN